MQTLGALEFLPITEVIPWDPASKDTVSLVYSNTVLLEAVRIMLGTCIRASTEARPCHWAWADQSDSATWTDPWSSYAHNCTTDHIEDWESNTHEFGVAERTIRLVFVPCPHMPEKTLVLGLELVGSMYEEIQRKAKIILPPPALPRRRLVDAKQSGETVNLRPPGASAPMSAVSTSTAAAAEIQDAPPYPQVPHSQAALQLSDADDTPSRIRNTPKSNEHSDAQVVTPPTSGSLDTVFVPETMSDVAGIINTLCEEIRFLRARDAARGLEMQGLKSAFVQLKTSVARGP